MVVCPKCGAKSEEDEKYCVKCGADMKTGTASSRRHKHKREGECFGQEEECFGIPKGGTIVGLAIGIIIIL